MPTEPFYLRERTLPEKLRYLADKLTDIGVELDEPFHLVARIGGVAFSLHMLADQLDPAHIDGSKCELT